MPFDATPLTNDTIVKLEKVYELLARRGGWIRNAEKLTDNKGEYAYCLIGAAREVGFLTSPSARINFANLLGFVSTSSVAAYNDTPSRRKHQVLTRVRDAIDRERERILNPL